MKVKKYIAPSMPEAMNKIRRDLGNEAVILNSKLVYTGGFLGLFRKKNIEVIAAIDEIDVKYEKELNKEVFPSDLTQSRQHQVQVKTENEGTYHDSSLIEEIHLLQSIVKDYAATNNMSLDDIHGPYEPVFRQLMNQNLDSEVLNDLKRSIQKHYYQNNENVSEIDAKSFITEQLITHLKDISYGGISLQKKYINVIGPTGVGKTTTLAKIAARTALDLKRKIAFITTDTYRIAAVEQLKTYAKILNAPIEVCYNLLDFKNAIHKFENFDHIFIDTAGRNFRNQEYVDDLKKSIDFNENMESFLVFSLTAKEQDLDNIYTQFSSVPIHKFIFTKLDETSTYGSLFNLSYKYKTGISYITVGQDVPDDIVEATPEYIIKKIIEDKE